MTDTTSQALLDLGGFVLCAAAAIVVFVYALDFFAAWLERQQRGRRW